MAFSARLPAGRFQHAHGRGAHGHTASTGAPAGMNGLDGRGAQFSPFAVHGMIRNLFHLQRPERIQPNVQGDERKMDALRAQALDQGGGEMQAGRGRRRRAVDAGVDRLIALAVGQRRVNIRRQRHVAQAL